MQRRHLLLTAAAWPWTSTVGAPVIDPQVKTLIADVIQAHGGAAVWRALRGLNAEGEIIAVTRGERGRYQRWMLRERQLRVETHYASSGETRILNGGKSWRSTAGEFLLPVTGIGHLAMVYQYKQLDLPYGLLQQDYSVRVLGHEPLDGAPCMVLHVSDDEGPAMRVHVDEATHRIAQVTGIITQGPASTTLSARFADYRSVEGVWLPFQINNFAAGAPISETRLQRYAINPQPDATRFAPPAAGGQKA